MTFSDGQSLRRFVPISRDTEGNFPVVLRYYHQFLTLAGDHGALHAAVALLGLPTLADKGYDGAGIGVHTPAKGAHLAPSTACRNQLLTRLRAEGERGIALLKTRWEALQRIRLCPQRIGAIVAAAPVLTSAERPIR